MKLLYISKFQFKKIKGITYAIPAYGNHFWNKYLGVFDSIEVLGEYVKKYLDDGTLSEITDNRISVEILPRNTAPHEFVNDFALKKILTQKINQADAILVKPSSRKGIMAINIAERLNKPYMIELTGDLNLTLKNHQNIFKRIYGIFLHRRILYAIKNCQFGLYVTQTHLQNVYPIAGKQCGCSDTVLPYISKNILAKRLSKIEAMHENQNVSLGIIASYHDVRKGIDTAIKALRNIKSKNIELHVLGLGTAHDRNKWLKYAKRYGVQDQLFFDSPISEMEKVLQWIDTMDMCILPSRSEGLPRCIVEALSRACPCIASNVCGLPELINHHWIHAPRDHKKLAELISEMISNKEFLKSAAAENYAHSFDYKLDILESRRNAFLSEFKDYCSKMR